jgi:hypothetical protein
VNVSIISFSKIFESRTLMTWGSFFAKSLSLIIVLPLILTKFSSVEVALWFLFLTIFGLQTLLDLGFNPTGMRVLSYAMGGASLENLNNLNQRAIGKPNWNLIGSIYLVLRKIYRRISFFWFLLIVFFGTYFIYKPVQRLDFPDVGFEAWSTIIVASTITLGFNQFKVFLQGVDEIALLRRWEMIFFASSSVSQFLVLILDGNLFHLVLVYQFWQIASVYRNFRLVKVFTQERKIDIQNKKINSLEQKQILSVIWPSAWRSGAGVIVSSGLLQLTGLFYAQFGNTDKLASYLIGIRLIQLISEFSRAPFYSKIPLLSRLFSEHKTQLLLEIVQKGMFFSYISFIVVVLPLGVLGHEVFEIIHSNVVFPQKILWFLLGLGAFLERYGSMHLQLYSLSNKIIWHIANGITGIIFIIVVFLLWNNLGILTFPIASIVSNLLFYTWYSAKHSYRLFSLNFFLFEKDAAFFPFAIYMLFITIVVFL